VPKSRSRRRPAQSSRPRTTRPSVVAQPAPGVRGKAERASAPALLWLSSKPAFLLPLLTVVLLVVGLAAPTAVGVPVLLLLAALVGWLSYLSWPVVQGVQRALRLGTVGLVLAAVAGRLTA
jgi:hypothetical protein